MSDILTKDWETLLREFFLSEKKFFQENLSSTFFHTLKKIFDVKNFMNFLFHLLSLKNILIEKSSSKKISKNFISKNERPQNWLNLPGLQKNLRLQEIRWFFLKKKRKNILYESSSAETKKRENKIFFHVLTHQHESLKRFFFSKIIK